MQERKKWLIFGLATALPLAPLPLVGLPRRALAQYEIKISLPPEEEFNQLHKRGLELIEQGKYGEAESTLQRALAIASQSSEVDRSSLAQAHYLLGTIDHRQQDFDAAKLDYEAALSANAEFVAAIINLGLISYEKGQLDEAIQYWQSAVEIDNSAAESQLALAIGLYERGEREQGLSVGEAALHHDVRYSSLEFLEQNLWGSQLLKAAEKFLGWCC